MIECLQRFIDYFEHLQPADLSRLPDYYDEKAHFKDPFNNVRGVVAIKKIFEHMFESLDTPRFYVRTRLLDGNQGFVTWDFHFRLLTRSRPAFQIHGSSHLIFNEQGQIHWHRDYWDVAEELYEKFPGLGWMLRRLKRRLCPSVTA